jgi:RNA-directed DNA polymerase
MVANILTDKLILQKWFKAEYVCQGELFPTDAGVPQRGIITPPTMLHTFHSIV